MSGHVGYHWRFPIALPSAKLPQSLSTTLIPANEPQPSRRSASHSLFALEAERAGKRPGLPGDSQSQNTTAHSTTSPKQRSTRARLSQSSSTNFCRQKHELNDGPSLASLSTFHRRERRVDRRSPHAMMTSPGSRIENRQKPMLTRWRHDFLIVRFHGKGGLKLTSCSIMRASLQPALIDETPNSVPLNL